MNTLTCFKAYDIRGELEKDISPAVAYRIGLAYAQHFSPQWDKQVVAVGGDARLTSTTLKLSLTIGLIDGGATVVDLGLTGTEELYYAAKALQFESKPITGAIVVTASHNPINYNGMKMVREEAIPISGDTGLLAIKTLAETCSNRDAEAKLRSYLRDKSSNTLPSAWLQGEAIFDQATLQATGKYHQIDNKTDYVTHLLTYIQPGNLRNLKIVVNAGNGAAGPALDELETQLNQVLKPSGKHIDFVKVHHQPDGTFPNGIPNPLLPEGRQATIDAVQAHQADFGVAWDGDFDRCFLFDEKGHFIDGYYIVGLLAQAFLQKQPGSRIIFDPRVYWNSVAVVEEAGGIPVKSKTGHAFIKERMRKEDAVYGGEMSAHHYFRDFAYCDSGMIPWLIVAELICLHNQPLSHMVSARMAAFPSSGEINHVLHDADTAMQAVLAHYQEAALNIDRTDGLGFEFENWRFNVRKSNTEPVLRLNIESRADESLLAEKIAELQGFLSRFQS